MLSRVQHTTLQTFGYEILPQLWRRVLQDPDLSAVLVGLQEGLSLDSSRDFPCFAFLILTG